jgi:hypothetical protein
MAQSNVGRLCNLVHNPTSGVCKTVQLRPCSTVSLLPRFLGSTMTKSAATTLKQLVSRLHEQASEMASIRAELNVQFERIAQMQVQLDQLPETRRGRQKLRVLLAGKPSSNGNRRSHD